MSTLDDALRILAERVLTEVRAWRASGGLVLRREHYIIRPDFRLRYSVDPTIMNNFDLGTVEKEEWHWKDVEAFLTERVLASPEHAQVLRMISDLGQNSELA